MTVREIYNLLCEKMPMKLAESWDNPGFLVGEGEREVKKVLVALDITSEVAKEAIEGGYDLIVSHHPLIFSPLKRVTSDSPISSIVLKLIKNDIAAICMHTNYDAANGGVGDALSAALGLKNVRKFGISHTDTFMKLCVFVPREDKAKLQDALFHAGAGKLGDYSECSFSTDGIGTFYPEEGANPYIGQKGARENAEETKLEVILPKAKVSSVLSAMRAAHPYEEPAFDLYDIAYPKDEYAFCRIGEIDECSFDDFARTVKSRLLCDGIRYVKCHDKVRTVAVGGGACASFASEAKAMGADVFVTGDMSYHNFLDAKEDGLSVIAAGHFQSENVAIPPLAEMIRAFGDIEVKQSEVHESCEKFM